VTPTNKKGIGIGLIGVIVKLNYWPDLAGRYQFAKEIQLYILGE